MASAIAEIRTSDDRLVSLPQWRRQAGLREARRALPRGVTPPSRGVGNPVDLQLSAVGKPLDLRPEAVGRPPRERDHQVRRARAVDQFGQPIELAEDRDRVGLRVDGQLPAPARTVDVPDQGQGRPGGLVEAPREPPQVPAGPDDQEPAAVVGGREAAGRDQDRARRRLQSWGSHRSIGVGRVAIESPGPRPARPRDQRAERPRPSWPARLGFPSRSTIGMADDSFQ